MKKYLTLLLSIIVFFSIDGSDTAKDDATTEKDKESIVISIRPREKIKGQESYRPYPALTNIGPIVSITMNNQEATVISCILLPEMLLEINKIIMTCIQSNNDHQRSLSSVNDLFSYNSESIDALYANYITKMPAPGDLLELYKNMVVNKYKDTRPCNYARTTVPIVTIGDVIKEFRSSFWNHQQKSDKEYRIDDSNQEAPTELIELLNSHKSNQRLKESAFRQIHSNALNDIKTSNKAGLCIIHYLLLNSTAEDNVEITIHSKKDQQRETKTLQTITINGQVFSDALLDFIETTDPKINPQNENQNTTRKIKQARPQEDLSEKKQQKNNNNFLKYAESVYTHYERMKNYIKEHKAETLLTVSTLSLIASYGLLYKNGRTAPGMAPFAATFNALGSLKNSWTHHVTNPLSVNASVFYSGSAVAQGVDYATKSFWKGFNNVFPKIVPQA